MVTPNKTGPKTMSSRLATMKFMQRGAATPSSSSPAATPEERGGKRQRLSNGSYNASPVSTPGGAEDVEEQKRQEVAEREGVAKGDTKWYLSVQPASKPVAESPLRIVSAGYSTLDAPARRSSAPEHEDIGAGAAAGRMNFGNFSRKKTVPTPATADSDSGSSSGSEDDDDDDEDDPTGAKALIKQSRKEAADKIRADRKAKRKSDGAESARLAESRRKKEVNLNKVTSISGGGGGSGSGRSMVSSTVCHACGKKGHMKAECPDSGPRKSRKLNY